MKLTDSIRLTLIALFILATHAASAETIHATVVKMSAAGYASVEETGLTEFTDQLLRLESGTEIVRDVRRYTASVDQRLPFDVRDLTDALRKLPPFPAITVLTIAGVSYNLRTVGRYVIIWPNVPAPRGNGGKLIEPAILP